MIKTEEVELRLICPKCKKRVAKKFRKLNKLIKCDNCQHNFNMPKKAFENLQEKLFINGKTNVNIK